MYMVQKLYLRFGSDEFNFFFSKKMNPQIMPQGLWPYFFSGVNARLPPPRHLLAVGAGPSLPTAALADPINRDGNLWVVPRAVSTSKLAPDWLHKSEQPIRSQVGKLTHLMTIASIYTFPFQYAADIEVHVKSD